MAGFEIVVRPVIFPNIRPAPARVLAPADDPSKGICEIKFASNHVVSFSYSSSVSTSKSKPTETQRRVDDVRIFQKEDDGTINRDNFVDVAVANKIWMDVGTTGQAPTDVKSVPETQIWHFARPEEQDNIEIKNRDRIIKSDSE